MISRNYGSFPSGDPRDYENHVRGYFRQPSNSAGINNIVNSNLPEHDGHQFELNYQEGNYQHPVIVNEPKFPAIPNPVHSNQFANSANEHLLKGYHNAMEMGVNSNFLIHESIAFQVSTSHVMNLGNELPFQTEGCQNTTASNVNNAPQNNYQPVDYVPYQANTNQFVNSTNEHQLQKEGYQNIPGSSIVNAPPQHNYHQLEPVPYQLNANQFGNSSEHQNIMASIVNNAPQNNYQQLESIPYQVNPQHQHVNSTNEYKLRKDAYQSNLRSNINNAPQNKHQQPVSIPYQVKTNQFVNSSNEHQFQKERYRNILGPGVYNVPQSSYTPPEPIPYHVNRNRLVNLPNELPFQMEKGLNFLDSNFHNASQINNLQTKSTSLQVHLNQYGNITNEHQFQDGYQSAMRSSVNNAPYCHNVHAEPVPYKMNRNQFVGSATEHQFQSEYLSILQSGVTNAPQNNYQPMDPTEHQFQSEYQNILRLGVNNAPQNNYQPVDATEHQFQSEYQSILRSGVNNAPQNNYQPVDTTEHQFQSEYQSILRLGVNNAPQNNYQPVDFVRPESIPNPVYRDQQSIDQHTQLLWPGSSKNIIKMPENNNDQFAPIPDPFAHVVCGHELQRSLLGTSETSGNLPENSQKQSEPTFDVPKSANEEQVSRGRSNTLRTSTADVIPEITKQPLEPFLNQVTWNNKLSSFITEWKSMNISDTNGSEDTQKSLVSFKAEKMTAKERDDSVIHVEPKRLTIKKAANQCDKVKNGRKTNGDNKDGHKVEGSDGGSGADRSHVDIKHNRQVPRPPESEELISSKLRKVKESSLKNKPAFGYAEPQDFEDRNSELRARLKRSVKRNNTVDVVMDNFENYSTRFLNDSMNAAMYYDFCEYIIRKKKFDGIFIELVALIPNIQKQQELWQIHAPKTTKKMESCLNCNQMLSRKDTTFHNGGCNALISNHKK